jgi:hypothetical protein
MAREVILEGGKRMTKQPVRFREGEGKGLRDMEIPTGVEVRAEWETVCCRGGERGDADGDNRMIRGEVRKNARTRDRSRRRETKDDQKIVV